jgi:hypothetical protein
MGIYTQPTLIITPTLDENGFPISAHGSGIGRTTHHGRDRRTGPKSFTTCHGGLDQNTHKRQIFALGQKITHGPHRGLFFVVIA